MQRKVLLNMAHVALWQRYAMYWLAYVAMAVVVGWSLGPKLEDVVFVTTLPLWGLIPYVAWCYAVAHLKMAVAVWRLRRKLY